MAVNKKTDKKRWTRHQLQLMAVFLVSMISIAVMAIMIMQLFLRSEPFRLSARIIQSSPEVAGVVGKVLEYQMRWPFIMHSTDEWGSADFTIKVIGTGGSIRASIALSKDKGKWRATSASYQDKNGYERSITIPATEEKKALKAVRQQKPVEDLKSGSLQPEGAGRPAGREEDIELEAGHRFFAQNEFEKAIIEYDKLVQNNPRNYLAYFWRGRALIKLNMQETAVSEFTKVIQLKPKEYEAYDWLGWLKTQNGNYDEAIRHLTKSVALNPKNGWAYYMRGECYYRKGDVEKALLDAEKSCRLRFKKGCLIYETLMRNRES
jgi:TolA-binding protein